MTTKHVCALALAFVALASSSRTSWGQTTPFPVQLTFEEGVFPDVPGATRDNAGITFGVPFSDFDDLHLTPSGCVPVDVSGPGVLRWQATPYELADPKDPTSKVLWATVDVVLDRVSTGVPRTDLVLSPGSGRSSGAALLSTNGNVVTIDTGAAQFRFRANGFAFLDEAWLGGVQVVTPNQMSGLVLTRGTEVYSSRWGESHIVVNRNGPACTQVDISGEAWNQNHTKVLCSYVVSLTAYALANAIDGRVTLIAGHALNRSELLFDSAQLVCSLVPSSSGYDCAMTHETGVLATSIAGGDTVRTVQFETSLPLESANRQPFYPDLPKTDVQSTNTSQNRILAGNRIIKRDGITHYDVTLHSNTDPSVYPMYLAARMETRGAKKGVALLAKHGPTLFPMAIECHGDGLNLIKLWPDDKPSVWNGSRMFFAVPYRAGEAREFSLALSGDQSIALPVFGVTHTFPVLARYSRFEDYGLALYREQGIPALSVADQDSMYRWMGLIDASDTVANLVPIRYWTPGPNGFHEVVYLEQNRTGGGYNQDFPERDILEYLRLGRIGAWMQAASNVNYIRLNHFRHHWPLGCDYKLPPIPSGYKFLTSRHDSDVEHDWWRSVRLYARLTGDSLLRREFLDHSRIFTDDNGRVMYYRSHAKGLEETALALSLAQHAYPQLPDDPCTGVSVEDTLQYKLEKRLRDWFARIYDRSRLYETEGWVMPQGTLLPGELGNPWIDPWGFPYWGFFTYMDRGVRHDGCYDCLDPNCRSSESQPYGRRTFHEWLATTSLAICLSVLPKGGQLETEAFLRLSQLGFSTMTMLHWAGQPNPCSSMPYLPGYAKQGDAAHVWLGPPCPEPGYSEAGPFQPRWGDGHLGYPYASEAARAVILQYAWTGHTDALEIACTKFHEVLAAQRFRRHWGDPCNQDPSYQNTYFPVNVNEPGHWSFLSTVMSYGPWYVKADFPAYNPEAKYYH